MQLHETISLLRRVKGWTQEETAEMLQMSLHGYANIERGETDPRKSKIEQLAQLFGVEPKDLMDTNGKNVLNNRVVVVSKNKELESILALTH